MPTANGPSQQRLPAPADVLGLVNRFHDHRDAYHAGRYNETQIRREFIDPFFRALGWDVWNEQGYAEAYKDVIHEDAIKIGGATKAPDYCFRIGGVRKFFVEAKKPSVDIKGDAGPAYQLRRYAWSAKLPLSILTDFEELAVYDCRIKPARTDPASTARVLYLRYDEYGDRWHELASIFARESILKGSFDKYAESTRRKRGTAAVDDAFLAEIEQWRESLARNLALRNPRLTQRDLNFAVQRTIDRIVFLRICEDRGIEPYGTLRGLLNGERVYDRLFERFRRADERYNSGLFHFTPEKGRAEAPDDLTPGLTIDDKVLKDILGRLYYPDSPYEFSVLPADILGQVYEQFLGKVIRLTKGHRAVVEEKPEVRKAGGVYYTPTYIVDYIVKHTVGKLVEGKTPQEVGGLTETFQPSRAKGVRPLAVLDPACGSGSFLLGAYQFLLDWYRDRYVADGPEKHATGRNPRLYQRAATTPLPLRERLGEGPSSPASPPLPSREGLGEGQGSGQGTPSTARNDHSSSAEWRLTTAERKRILLAHIHGVDIDPQAVEVTKLSLLLKCLEGETAETLGANLRLFHERALPDLAGNIKCGNSLIGPDFYDGRQMEMFDEEARLRINVFDWHAEFPHIFASSGQAAGRFDQYPERQRRADQYPERQRRADQYPERERRAEQYLERERRAGPGADASGTATGAGYGASPYPERRRRADQCPERERRADQYPERERRAGPGADASGSHRRAAPGDHAGDRWPGADASQYPERERRADQYPERERRAAPGADASGTALDAGFDAVIGNPPYGALFGDPERQYLRNHVPSFASYEDSYVAFLERGLRLLVADGMLGMIIPSAVFGGPAYAEVRKFLLTCAQWERAILLPYDVFWAAYIDTAIVCVRRADRLAPEHAALTFEYPKRERIASMADLSYRRVPQAIWLSDPEFRIVADPLAAELSTALRNRCPRSLGDAVDMKRGVLPGPGALSDQPTNRHKHLYFEGDVYRYVANERLQRFAAFDESMRECPRSFKWFAGPRILLRRLVNRRFRLMATAVSDDFITNKNLYTLLPRSAPLELVLGILNSRLISYLYVKQVTQAVKDDFAQVTIKDIRSLPWPELGRHDVESNIIPLVKQMLLLHKQLACAKTPHDKNALQRQIDATDRQIDRLVYELYGLTEDEIRIVEEATQ